MSVGAVITNIARNITLKSITGPQVSGTVAILRIGSSGTTPAITDIGLAAPIGSYYAMLSGYPTYDTVNQKMTNRYFISSVSELNGATMTEAGEFFSGASYPQGLFSRNVFTPITKSGSDEIAFILISKIT